MHDNIPYMFDSWAYPVVHFLRCSMKGNLNSSYCLRFWRQTLQICCDWRLHSENTQLLCKGKYHCTADLLFDRLGFGQTSKSVYSFNSTKQLNPNRRSAVQWYFPLQSNWVFSVAFSISEVLQSTVCVDTLGPLSWTLPIMFVNNLTKWCKWSWSTVPIQSLDFFK